MLSKTAILLIKAYKWIRPLSKSGRCIYRPTCTAYAMEAIQKHGVFHGIILMRSRASRCNEFEQSGYDPVPDSINK